MQASTSNERFPLSVQIARNASRFVTIWGRGPRHSQLFSPSDGGFGSGISALPVRSPLQNPARSRGQRNLWPTRKTTKRKQRKKNESTDSVKKNTNPTTSHRTGADRSRRVHSRASPRNAQLRSYHRQPFRPSNGRYRARRSLSVWVARLDVQKQAAGVASPHKVRGDSDVYVTDTRSRRGSHWVAHASGSQPYHGHSWRAHGVRG